MHRHLLLVARPGSFLELDYEEGRGRGGGLKLDVGDDASHWEEEGGWGSGGAAGGGVTSWGEVLVKKMRMVVSSSRVVQTLEVGRLSLDSFGWKSKRSPYNKAVSP